ncbi:735_t:CDS:2, partial [Racocetra fulgida]
TPAASTSSNNIDNNNNQGTKEDYLDYDEVSETSALENNDQSDLQILSDTSKIEVEYEDQRSEDDFILNENDEVAEIISDLSLNNDSEASKIAQAMKRYI